MQAFSFLFVSKIALCDKLKVLQPYLLTNRRQPRPPGNKLTVRRRSGIKKPPDKQLPGGLLSASTLSKIERASPEFCFKAGASVAGFANRRNQAGMWLRAFTFGLQPG
jgi:hypothetical protein